MKRKELRSFYETRVEQTGRILAKDRRIIAWLSLARLIVFVGGITLTFFMFRTGIAAGIISLLLTAIIFAILLKVFALRVWKKDYNSKMLEVNRSEILAIDEDYSGFGEGKDFIDTSHDFSHDIDMFGPGSVFQSLNRTSTEKGEIKLAECLLNPYRQSAEFGRRKEAIRELAEKTEWRHRFSSLGMMNLTSAEETERFARWINEDPEFSRSRILKYMLVALPLITISLFILWTLSLLSVTWFIVIFIFNLFLVGLRLGKLSRFHARVSNQSNYLSIASMLIGHISNGDFSAPFLKDQQQRLAAGSSTAEKEVRALSRLLNGFDSRLNMIVGVILNGILLWDYQCVVRIEKWKSRLAEYVPDWFDSIAVMDAISSLGYFANNNPDFVYPEVSDTKIFLEAENMGHHLIPSSKRITNNYSIAQKESVNIITGANMAGKSTFLRTVAVNLILAMCGAPVCAGRFSFTPINLYTSMRTSDSLSEEESYFFAELKRLRGLVERLEGEDKPFFILDEILKGTNSKDKSEGSIAFLEKVIRLGGTGLIATHDISLGLLEKKYPEKVLNNCFEIEIEDGDVKFDFLLREGITSKMNAALLMKQQGII